SAAGGPSRTEKPPCVDTLGRYTCVFPYRLVVRIRGTSHDEWRIGRTGLHRRAAVASLGPREPCAARTAQVCLASRRSRRDGEEGPRPRQAERSGRLLRLIPPRTSNDFKIRNPSRQTPARVSCLLNQKSETRKQ